MNKRYNSIDKFEINMHSSSNKNLLNSGDKHTIFGPHFDIKNYFDEISKRNIFLKSPKKTISNRHSLLKPLTSIKIKNFRNITIDENNISTLKNNNKNYFTIETEPTIHNKNKYIFNSNHSSKNIYQNGPFLTNLMPNRKNCFMTSIEICQNDNNNNNLEKNRYLIPLSSNDRHKRLFSISNKKIKNNLHVSDIIKEIREKYKKKSGKDLKNDYIAYTNENVDAVLDSKILLDNYRDQNEWKIKIDENNFNQFSLNKKKVCKNNILSKLIDKEREKLIIKQKLREESIEDKKNTIDNDEKLFEEIKTGQKLNYKVLQNYRMKLEDCKKDVFYLKEVYRYKVQNKEAEIMKKLFEINELREYAKFVNNMLDNDIEKYQKEIYPSDYEKKIDLNALVKNALEVYADYLNEDEDENSNIENKKKGNEPEIIYDEFKGLEDRIRYALNLKDIEYEQIRGLKKHNELILKEIINKKNMLEEEFNKINEECIEIKEYLSNDRNSDKYFHLLAQELFNCILGTFSYSNIYKTKPNEALSLTKICDMAKKCQKCLSEKEIFINKHITNIEKYEEENPQLFKDIIDLAIERIILNKQTEIKQANKIKESIKRINAIKKLEKISFLIRKVEKPFHVKKEVIEKIDPMEIIEKEKRELLTYQ